MRTHLTTLLLLAVVLIPSALAAQGDVEGSRDHPLLSRYQGSRIIGYEKKEYDAHTLALGPANRNGTPTEETDVEGTVTRILYLAPEGRSTLEVYRNYERALTQAGFEPMWRCSEEECGRMFRSIQPHGRELIEYAWSGRHRDWRYLAARGAGPSGDVYVALNVAVHTVPVSWIDDRVITQVDVIEAEGMDEGMVTVDAAAMAGDLESRGKAVLYGILFAIDQAALLPESDATLAEVATLLEREPDLRIHVVGHTDDEGALDYNLELSARRAQAVRAALVERFGVAPARLVANGVGPLAPVASNASEDGRALNRRVELVPIRNEP